MSARGDRAMREMLARLRRAPDDAEALREFEYMLLCMRTAMRAILTTYAVFAALAGFVVGRLQ